MRARSPLRHCQIIKRVSAAAAPARRPITRGVCHVWGSALYCMARKNMTAVARRIALPMRSNSTMTLAREREEGVSAVGVRKKKVVAAAIKPPNGKLK